MQKNRVIEPYQFGKVRVITISQLILVEVQKMIAIITIPSILITMINLNNGLTFTLATVEH
jgi:hypothetical protein